LQRVELAEDELVNSIPLRRRRPVASCGADEREPDRDLLVEIPDDDSDLTGLRPNNSAGFADLDDWL
jgi:hypothetical protein